MRKKITLIGAGQIGGTLAHLIALKELADVVYVCFQFASVMDWDLDEALRRVHQSNLSKLDDEGKPVLRADGKVMKGPNYQPPDLSDLVCLK